MADGDQRSGIRVTITDEAGRPLRMPALAAWLRSVAPARAQGAVSLALVPDASMRRLNRRYAAVDRVTDVLAFSASPAPAGCEAGILGDVVIATGAARRQAREAGHSYRTELRVLALHGLLHLLGYDHHGDSGRMARVEARLRRKGGLAAAGLIERARES